MNGKTGCQPPSLDVYVRAALPYRPQTFYMSFLSHHGFRSQPVFLLRCFFLTRLHARHLLQTVSLLRSKVNIPGDIFLLSFSSLLALSFLTSKYIFAPILSRRISLFSTFFNIFFAPRRSAFPHLIPPILMEGSPQKSSKIMPCTDEHRCCCHIIE